jgi:predicted outer membrane repeat protein
MKTRILIFLLLAAPLTSCDNGCPTRSSPGPVVIVSPDGAGDYPSIQEALSASQHGTTIVLEDGTYVGDSNRDLDFQGKAITLRSKSGSALHCTIDCGADTATAHRGFYFHSGEGPSSVIEGITITGGFHHIGGGIFCDSSSSPTIRACIVRDNRADAGAGMFCAHNSNAVLASVLFENNAGSNEGGGLECFEADPTLDQCTFRGNSARNVGGGIFCHDADPVLNGCHFEANTGHFGGGFYCQISAPVFTTCIFLDNWSRWCGAGAYINTSSYPVFRYCTFAGNESTCGSSISSDRGSVTLVRNCTMVSNIASRAAGVECDFAGKAVLINTIIAFNPSGFAVYCRDPDSTLDLVGCDLYGNALGDWVGCVESQLQGFGNFQQDPQFCDLQTRDYHLRRHSPCAAPVGENIAGAWPVGCD